ncbi:MAG: hypothetical protein KDI36_00845 [Pseudomonadales bacterium]|nr:hypothetical protein [Pseudomonadales bacterium]
MSQDNHGYSCPELNHDGNQMEYTFSGAIAFAFLTSLLLVGTLLRARFTLLQNMLVPASLIGGTLVCIPVTGGTFLL